MKSDAAGPRDAFFDRSMVLKIVGFLATAVVVVSIQIMKKPQVVASAVRAMGNTRPAEQASEGAAPPGFKSFDSGSSQCRVVASTVQVNGTPESWSTCGVRVLANEKGEGTVSVLLLRSGTSGNFTDPGPGNLLLELTTTSPDSTTLAVDGARPPTDGSVRALYRPWNGNLLQLVGVADVGRNTITDEGTYEIDASLNGIHANDTSMVTLSGGLSVVAADATIEASAWLAAGGHETTARAHLADAKAKSQQLRQDRLGQDDAVARQRVNRVLDASQARRLLDGIQSAVTRAAATDGAEQRRICQVELDNVDALEANQGLLSIDEQRVFLENARHLRSCFDRTP